MGSILSAFLGGGATTADDSPSEPHLESWSFTHPIDGSCTTTPPNKSLNCVFVGASEYKEPAIHAMSAKFADVDFVKIEVNELSDVMQEFKVQAMPMFVLIKQGKEVERVIGAKKDELERKIAKHKEAPKF